MSRHLVAKIIHLSKRVHTPGTFTRQVSITLIVQFLSLFLGIAHGAVLARCLGPEGKGIVTLALLVPSVLGLFLNLGISVAGVYFSGTRQFDIAILTSNAIGAALPLIGAGVGIIGLLHALGWLEHWVPGVPLSLLLLALSTFPLTLLSSYFSGLLQGLQRLTAVNLLKLLQSAILLAGDLVFLVALGFSTPGAIWAYVSSLVLKTVLAALLLNREGGRFIPRWDRPVLAAMLKFGLRGHVGNVLQFFNYRLDVFLVNYFLNPAEVGIYGVASRLAEVLWQLPNAVGFVIFPKAAATAPEKMNRFTPRVFRITLGLLSIGAVGLAVFGKYAILRIYDTAFLDAYPAMLALLPGIVLLGSAKVLTNEIAGRGYPQYNSISSGLAMILTVVLDLTMIPRYGINGAAWASTAAYTGVFLLSIIFYLKISHQTRITSQPEMPVMTES